ncbi:tRNA pseudouridine synthase C [Luminiphilus syltensis NOR5-1B]|uniref:tRNA pseudouridine synthase C n=1 Tax=Luminiphilus syltensis NOR5-1B TaxID=565045 RepID=B8KSR6_9GAMM|nr:YqcC family protein [Luminiphilus syltensis]EED36894.1 tRNA pseudouridine synthase C [Luminiphilus syltensis NOR5-1B]
MTSLDHRLEIAARLIDVEAALRQLRLWDETPPSAEALASAQPFAVDTLDFYQWLQFIFLPTMHGIIERGQAMPDSCAVAPMAEESFNSTSPPVVELIVTLEELDQLITAAP